MKAESRYEIAWVTFQRSWTRVYVWGGAWVTAVSTVGYLSRRYFDMDVLTILTMLGFYIPLRRAMTQLAEFRCPRCREPFFADRFANVWNHRCVGCQLHVWSHETEDDQRQAVRRSRP